MIVPAAQLVRLTMGKIAATVAFRWIPFFLPTLAVAFASTTAELTLILGVGEMGALVSLLASRAFDRGHERSIMCGALGLTACSSFVALGGSVATFAVAFALLIIGLSLYTVGGHTYLSRRTPFTERGRAIGLFETSWALSLLIGAPTMAGLINRFGWRGPFVAIGIGATLLAVVVARTPDTARIQPVDPAESSSPSLDAAAWRVIAASAAIGVSGMSVIVIIGTWLDDELGVSTGGVGLAAMAFGLVELMSSLGSAASADRLGKTRSTRAMMLVLLAGLAVMSQAAGSLAIGLFGLLLFFGGFEYSLVTSFGIISETMPSARGRALAAGNAVGTVCRGLAAVVSGQLYARSGIDGPLLVSAIGGIAAVALLAEHHRSSAGQLMAQRERRDFLPG